MKEKILLVILLVLSPLTVIAQNDSWEKAEEIVRNLKQVAFPDRMVSITDFGAVANDETHLAHEAINQAIRTVSEQGGGTVIVPDSVYYTGPITMKSNVRLHLSDKALLKFSTDINHYFPAVHTHWEGLDCYNTHPLIYAYRETNIAITGRGTLDAQGARETWWSRGTIERNSRKQNPSDPLSPEIQGSRIRLLQWGEMGTPLQERVFTPEDGLRPQFVNLCFCQMVLIEGITLLNSPFWTLHPLFCNDLIVRGVTINNHGPNGDGCNPESCNGVLIENCVFNTGDDCIAIKSGRNEDGRRWNTPSQNIVVRGCTMADGHGGVVIGSEISGGFRNLFVENCTMDSPNLDRVIRIKTSNCRGGIIENVFVRNVKVGQCREAVLRINLNYEPRENCNRAFNPIVRNVHLENVTSNGSQYGLWLYGFDDEENIYDITLKDCHFNGVSTGSNYVKGRIGNNRFENCSMNGKKLESQLPSPTSDRTAVHTSDQTPENKRRLYDFIVPDDGSFEQAIEAANSREDIQKRFYIFVRRGDYIIPASTTKTVTGMDGKEYPDPRTDLTASRVSIIGEGLEVTTVKNTCPTNTVPGQWGSACPIEGLRKAYTLKNSGQDNYLQDIRLANGMADRTGRGEAYEESGDRTIMKNVGLWGYQDTYCSNRTGGRYYIEGGVIRGRTDYLCGKGDIYFNKVEFRQCDRGGYIVAPSNATRYGYVMRDCLITGERPDIDGTFTLGRPWGKGTPTAWWINTTCRVRPSYKGWDEMSGGWPAHFAEYGSKDANGMLLDTSRRKTTWQDKDGGTHENVSQMTAEEAEKLTIKEVLGGDGWNPEELAANAPAPTNVRLVGNTLLWNDDARALCFAVCRNGAVWKFTTETQMQVPADGARYSVRAANAMGGLGQAAQAVPRNAMNETDPAFFRTEEARRIGEQILLFQRVTGGWPKNTDMVSPLSEGDQKKAEEEKARRNDSTIDNGATCPQLTFLARLYQATGEERYRDVFRRGIDFLLSGQYDNGGWPQFWPESRGYQVHITYNDNAMVNVLKLIRAVADAGEPYGGDLVDEQTRAALDRAFWKGIDCILNTQIVVDGRPTVWCQQHDHVTLLPAAARAYELPSFCSAESCDIVRLLMSLPNPDKRVRTAVHGAMEWFNRHRIKGFRLQRTMDAAGKTANVELVPDSTAPDLWARFYDLEECLPFVCDRDGIPRRHLDEIGLERRTGYSWYNSNPARLFPLYKEWCARHVPKHDSFADWLVYSEMQRTPDPLRLDFATNPKWTYVVGIELEAMLDVYLRNRDERIMRYLNEYVERMVDDEGNVVRYKYDDFNLDNIRPAHFLFRLNQLTPREGSQLALNTFFRQLINQPRTDEGVYWHKAIYRDQVWLDGIFMGLPFKALAAPTMLKGKSAKARRRELKAYYDDIVDQIMMTDARTFDPQTGLWKHAWDSKRSIFWADPETGRSKHTWGRAMGWFTMAMIEILDALPADYARRGEVIDLLQRSLKAAIDYQDAKTGAWYDVLDVRDPRNYLEATATSMFAYCLLKGYRLGYLDESYKEAGVKAYRGIVNEFLSIDGDGLLSLDRCCEVSGLGPENNPRRDGSFDYYMSERVRSNDGKGLAPFIWATLEMERLDLDTGVTRWP